MSTEFTKFVEDMDIAFADWALICARATGPLVRMRDEPLEAEIPTAFEPRTHYANELNKCHAEIAKIKGMTARQCLTAARREYELRKGRLENHICSAAKKKSNCLKMLEHVQNWPTSQFAELREFMLGQLNSAISDISSSCNYYESTLAELSFPTSSKRWRKDQLATLLVDVERYSKSQCQEEEYIAWANASLKSLREELQAASKCSEFVS